MGVVLMKKVLLLLLSSVLFFAPVIYLTKSASVLVGSEKVFLNESRGEVLLKNTIGQFRGSGRCAITGLVFSWTPMTTLLYSSSEGVIFSTYAIEALMKMDKNEAYAIAQQAFDRLQEKSWSLKGKKLLYPLQPKDLL